MDRAKNIQMHAMLGVVAAMDMGKNPAVVGPMSGTNTKARGSRGKGRVRVGYKPKKKKQRSRSKRRHIG